MPTGNAGLIEFITANIRARGPQSFAWFMHQALYHPSYGYYSSGRAAIGRDGDYFTNASIGPLFGRLLAAQFAEIWERLDRPENFVIVEQGAHDGRFADDVLASIQKDAPEFFSGLRYRIIEPFLAWEDRQRRTLDAFRDKVEWRREIEPFTGVHFSNELVDAMPVRLFEKGLEKIVDLRGDEFEFVRRETNDPEPFNRAALDWIDAVAENLECGYVLAIDYGHNRSEPSETVQVQVRAGHRHLGSPFEQIGQADITAHVDWSSMIERARQAGLEIAGFSDQHHFLTGIVSNWPDLLSGSSTVKAKRELHTLLHPEMMGRSFQALALARNVQHGLPLAGLRFARSISP